ncbi:MAG: winged helix-turn-helix domain-containing protein [archaeon]
MAQKRDRLQVIKDILQVIKENKNEIKPTPLLRYSNLSSQRFTEYISELQEKGFIEERKDKVGRKYFSLTDKGQRYLEKYNIITGFIEDFDL